MELMVVGWIKVTRRKAQFPCYEGISSQWIIDDDIGNEEGAWEWKDKKIWRMLYYYVQDVRKFPYINSIRLKILYRAILVKYIQADITVYALFHVHISIVSFNFLFFLRIRSVDGKREERKVNMAWSKPEA